MEQIITYVLEHGGLGVALFLFVTIPLAAHARELHNRTVALADKLSAVEAARITDAKEVRAVMIDATREIATLAQEQVRAQGDMHADHGKLLGMQRGSMARIVDMLEKIDEHLERLEERLTTKTTGSLPKGAPR